jgi:hypothetical protein
MNNLNQIIEKFKSVKARANVLVEMVAPGHEMAEASIAILWESFFSLLCDDSAREDLLDVSQLNAVAGVFEKLMRGFSQLRTLEKKAREEASTGMDQGFDPQALEEVEKRFNIISYN